jgi:pyruvate,water dikinase
MSQAMIRTDPVLPLRDPLALDSSIVGSKAANLATLLQAGFPVPDGVVLTTVDAQGGVTSEDRTAVVERVIDLVGDRPVAVRSSGIAEDLVDASFAGQYETLLEVQGREQLASAIDACLASARSERAIMYGGSRGDGRMAVLIQPMVEARAAGVAFSAHPVSGARDVVVVNAVHGIGDSVTAGAVTPEEWLVTGDVATASRTNAGVLAASQAVELARLVRRVEGHFGRPQDVEWAIGEDGPVVLQARPITALPQAPVEPIPIPIEVPPGYWEHDASHFPNASYPIDSFIPDLVSKSVKTWVGEFGYLFDGIEFRDIGGWTYQRLRPIGGRDGPDPPGWLMWLLVRSVPVMRRRIAVAREAVRTDKAGRYIERWKDTWLSELAQMISTLQAVDRATLSDTDLERHIDDVIALGARGIEVHTLVHGSLAPIMFEFARTCRQLLGWDLAEALALVNGTSFKSTEPARRLHDLARMAAERPSLLEHTATPEDQVVLRLESLDPSFATAFRDYLTEFGHRALGDSCAEPTIAERPSFVLDMIRGQLEAGFEPDAVEEANREARDEALARARGRLADDPGTLPTFERTLDRARDAYPAREDNEFYTLSAPFALVRYVVLELGARLATRDVIAERDDVLFLRIDEARAALSDGRDRRGLVSHRERERAWAVANPGPPSYGKGAPMPASLSFLPRDARLPMESMLWSLESMLAIGASKTAGPAASAIQGTPAAAGAYTGPVRIIRGEREFDKLRGGDVLVCPITSPVWSVLFPGIGALVTDTGGILSHPAIIAREYRIPAVVATANATALLRDGQIVTVDGSAGTVTAA